MINTSTIVSATPAAQSTLPDQQTLYLRFGESPSPPSLDQRVASLLEEMQNSRIFSTQAEEFIEEQVALFQGEALFLSGRQDRALVWIIVKAIQSAIERIDKAGDICIELLKWEDAFKLLLQEVLLPHGKTAEDYITLFKRAESLASHLASRKAAIQENSKQGKAAFHAKARQINAEIQKGMDEDYAAYVSIQQGRVASLDPMSEEVLKRSAEVRATTERLRDEVASKVKAVAERLEENAKIHKKLCQDGIEIVRGLDV